jgi:tRNA-dihydrouridine synthase A
MFAGRPGARLFRRHLATEAGKPGAGLETLREAVEHVRRTTAQLQAAA